MKHTSRMTPLRTGLALLVLTFAAGVGIGAAAERLLVAASPHGARVFDDMSPVLDALRLSTRQRREAQAILNRNAPRSERAMVELAGRLRSISDSVDAELRTILTAAQQRSLDSLRHPITFILKHTDGNGASAIDTVVPPKTR